MRSNSSGPSLYPLPRGEGKSLFPSPLGGGGRTGRMRVVSRYYEKNNSFSNDRHICFNDLLGWHFGPWDLALRFSPSVRGGVSLRLIVSLHMDSEWDPPFED